MSFSAYFNGRVEEIAAKKASAEAERKEAIETLSKIIYDNLRDENFVETIKDGVMTVLISSSALGDNWQKVNDVFGLTNEWGQSSATNDVIDSLKRYPDLNGLKIINVGRLYCNEELNDDCPKAIKGNYYFGLRIAIK